MNAYKALLRNSAEISRHCISTSAEWRNFAKVIEKAKIACTNAGGETVNHFVDLNKMIDIKHGTQRDVQEVDFKRWEEETCEEIGLKIDQSLTD